ncbi:MAG TPA: glycosyltransferase family 4 protein [Pyrinomonadaceae bacterium]|nr:glycosyltransferase family 4 protein [Pyrinomonadaceae bacterium]
MNITFVTPSLACGGAERCVTLLTQGLLSRGHDVSVVTLYGREQDFFTLPAAANRLALSIDGDSPTVIHGLTNNLRRLRILRQAIKSTTPDIVVSHIHRTNVMTIMALGRMRTPVVAVEHNDPVMNPAGVIWDTLRRRTYPRARKLVSVSEGVDQHFSWLPESQRAVIHNPIALPPKHAAADTEARPLWIASMGRLTQQKGFDLLLNAFAQVAANRPEWNLRIIGDGPLRLELEELAATLKLSERVSLVGLVQDPTALLQDSELFVMASRFEGFPYAALEALASGLPVIYTDCPSGPREIIRNEVDGLLVPTGEIAAISAAMDRLMSNPSLRRSMAARAPEVLERFGVDRIISRWEELFEDIRAPVSA